MQQYVVFAQSRLAKLKLHMYSYHTGKSHRPSSLLKRKHRFQIFKIICTSSLVAGENTKEQFKPMFPVR